MTGKSSWYVLGVIAAAGLLWAGAFFGFLAGDLALSSDAISYYEHTKFAVDHLGRGIFPQWNPHWYGGLPTRFFFQRIGVYNPLLAVIIALVRAGVPAHKAYLLYQTGYFFLGGIGFFLLARRVLKDDFAALLAFLLLVFSSLGTRIFDSYLIILFVPIVWFFYFLVEVAEAPRARPLVGLTLALMTLETTYIPFYFLLILFVSLTCLLAVYPRRTLQGARRLAAFALRHKALAAVCLAGVVLASVPGWQFFREVRQGGIVMPLRHSRSALSHQLSVGVEDIASWGIAEELVYATYFLTAREMLLSVFYLPPVFYLLALLGTAAAVNRKLVLLLTGITVLLLVGTPLSCGLFVWLFRAVPFFRYFKNLHFLLWLGVLPAAVLFVAGQFAQLRQMWSKSGAPARGVWAAALVLLHLTWAGALLAWGERQPASYAAAALSLAFFLTLLRPRSGQPETRLMSYVLLLLAVSCQPLAVFRAMARHAEPLISPYLYDVPYLDFEYTRPGPTPPQVRDAALPPDGEVKKLYIAAAGYNWLNENLGTCLLEAYTRHKFKLYDLVVPAADRDLDVRQLAENIRSDRNFVYVDRPAAPEAPPGRKVFPPGPVLNIGPDSDLLRVTAFDSNAVKLRTRLPVDKFLVYTDNFDPHWKATVNGRPVTVYRANAAFKGIWLPQGDNTVVFFFERRALQALNVALLLLFNALFYGLLWLSWPRRGARRGPESLESGRASP